MGLDLKKVVAVASKYKVALGGMLAIVATCTGIAACGTKEGALQQSAIVTIEDEIVALASSWPSSFISHDYIEPEFVDD